MLKIKKSKFYNEYHGHRTCDLQAVHTHLKAEDNTPLIFLAGDSTLDNKYWFGDEAEAVNGYQQILSPSQSRMDIAYWLNKEIERRDMEGKLAAINCAVEESTIGQRACGRLLPQDKFILENIEEKDILVVSVGGNDIALRPSCCTAINMLSLVCCTNQSCLEKCSCGCAIPCDDCCAGCVCSCASNACAFPPGMGYFIHLFGVRMQSLISRMTKNKRPRVILVCMVYFLDETSGNSWAETVLGLLGYNSNPRKLQELIRQVFRLAVQNVKIDGSIVVPVPLYEALDGKDTRDYCQRVEPSARGGEKMAKLIMDALSLHIGHVHYQPPMERGDDGN